MEVLSYKKKCMNALIAFVHFKYVKFWYSNKLLIVLVYANVLKGCYMKKKIINWAGITWFMLMIMCIIFFFIAIGFIVFPDKYKIPFSVILIILLSLLGYFSIRKNKKNSKKIVVTIINCVLCVAVLTGSIYLPILQSKMKGVFVEPSNTQEIKINLYVMTAEYKINHQNLFMNTESADDLSEYKDKKFITQSQMDQDNQAYALEDIQKQLGVNSLNLLSKDDLWGALSALYNGSGDVL